MSRADEIAQGLRHESGSLTFPLDVLEYNQGHADYQDGVAPPRVTSASYDLGRARARESREFGAEVMANLGAQQERSSAALRDMLKDRPDLLAEYDAKITAIRKRA